MFFIIAIFGRPLEWILASSLLSFQSVFPNNGYYPVNKS
jgi:hypothetical protein